MLSIIRTRFVKIELHTYIGCIYMYIKRVFLTRTNKDSEADIRVCVSFVNDLISIHKRQGIHTRVLFIFDIEYRAFVPVLDRRRSPLPLFERTVNHSLCTGCQMALTADLLKGRIPPYEVQGALVLVEFVLRSRLRWFGAAVAIRCPFSRPVLVCFGNDPSTPNEIR